MLHISLTLFGLIGLGYAIARLGWLKDQAVDWLTAVLFYGILPFVLFYHISILPIEQTLAWPYIGAYLAASLTVIALTLLTSHICWHRKPAHLVLNAMASSHTNTAFLALPFFLMMFHTATPAASVLLAQIPLNIFYIAGFEVTTEHNTLTHRWFMPIHILLKNPILLGSLLGLLFSALHLTLPSFLHHSLHALSHINAWVALITLGLSLGIERVPFTTQEKNEITLLVAFKAILHPLLAYAMGRLFHLSGFALTALVLMAAMPTAKNTFVLARHYKVGAQRANLIVLITTTVALVSLNGVLWLMTAG